MLHPQAIRHMKIGLSETEIAAIVSLSIPISFTARNQVFARII
jgi:hypothetical protein